jgi:eukaryotic-like serine/threonine-protein kinase
MHFACPHCQAALDYSGRRPHFCSFCGKPLPPETKESTPSLGSEAATLPPSPDRPSPNTGEAPESIGGYRLLRRLGEGGMGSVYEAEDPASGQRVALKLIVPQYAAAPDAVERFRQEGRLASLVRHPRCVFVHKADQDNGLSYIVMELMPGKTLQDLVQEKGPLPAADGVAKALDIIDGLREAHRLGIIHRDIKPSNCFLEDDGRVKVGDFGLCKSLTSTVQLTRTGAFLGTPLYASPEQVRAEPLDPQTDVYSVAATLFFLLAGRAPHQTGDPVSTMASIVCDDAPSLCGLRPELPGALDQVVLRGLQRDRERRWKSMDEFRTALLPFAPRQRSLGAYLVACLTSCWSLGCKAASRWWPARIRPPGSSPNSLGEKGPGI